jgi:hypothetical protein
MVLGTDALECSELTLQGDVRADGGMTEREIVRDNNPLLTGGVIEHLDVRAANEVFLVSCAHVTAPRPQAGYYVWSNVLV